jgi:CheY-like chemotaxis protein
VSRKKILIVDDTRTILRLEQIILGDGFEYIEARDGKEAFERAIAEQPDLILMDLNMPGHNGLFGLRHLKEEPRTKQIPVVIVTARGEPEAMELCRALGCAAFVTKPLDRVVLSEVVGRFVGVPG